MATQIRQGTRTTRDGGKGLTTYEMWATIEEMRSTLLEQQREIRRLEQMLTEADVTSAATVGVTQRERVASPALSRKSMMKAAAAGMVGVVVSDHLAGSSVALANDGDALTAGSRVSATHSTVIECRQPWDTSSDGYGFGVTDSSNAMHVNGTAAIAANAWGTFEWAVMGYGKLGGGVYGYSASGDVAVKGESENQGTGLDGRSLSGYGVYGLSTTGNGVYGSSTSTDAIKGEITNVGKLGLGGIWHDRRDGGGSMGRSPGPWICGCPGTDFHPGRGVYASLDGLRGACMAR